jgi:hypothetical protein
MMASLTSSFHYVSLAEQVTIGLDRAVATMVKGELAEVIVKSEYGFGNTEVQRQSITVPSCSTLIYEVELIDFTKVLVSLSFHLLHLACVFFYLLCTLDSGMAGKRIMGDEWP